MGDRWDTLVGTVSPACPWAKQGRSAIRSRDGIGGAAMIHIFYRVPRGIMESSYKSRSLNKHFECEWIFFLRDNLYLQQYIGKHHMCVRVFSLKSKLHFVYFHPSF